MTVSSRLTQERLAELLRGFMDERRDAGRGLGTYADADEIAAWLLPHLEAREAVCHCAAAPFAHRHSKISSDESSSAGSSAVPPEPMCERHGLHKMLVAWAPGENEYVCLPCLRQQARGASSLPAVSGPILVWRFHDAPKEYQELSRHGGDEDWLALVPKRLAGEYIGWLESGSRFGCCDVSEHPLENGDVVHIGAHA